MNIRNSIVILSGVIALSACGEAQLNGPVAGADILVELLGQEGAQHQFTRTSDEQSTRDEVGSDKWDKWGSRDKFAWIGNFDLDSAFVDADRLYLVEARNGSDVDFNKDGEYDALPAEILGRWRAIIDGATLRSGDARVNLLTESTYQFIKGDLNNLSEDSIREWLDTLAGELVTDINGDGVVDYNDVMEWSNGSDTEGFLGSNQALEALAEAIANSSSEEDVYQAAMALWESLGIDLEQFQERFGEVGEEFSTGDSPERGAAFLQALLEKFRSAGDSDGAQPGDFSGEDGPLGWLFGPRDASEDQGN